MDGFSDSARECEPTSKICNLPSTKICNPTNRKSCNLPEKNLQALTRKISTFSVEKFPTISPTRKTCNPANFKAPPRAKSENASLEHSSLEFDSAKA